MSVSVAPAEDADMLRLFEIASLAFNVNEPIWDAFWPDHSTEAGRKAGSDIMRKIRETDKDTQYLKAFDPSTGEIMGMAKWNIYDNSFPGPLEFDATYYGGEQGVTYITKLTTQFLSDRNEAIQRNNGNLLSLDILTVDPAYQKRGVGDALVKWGINKADEMGVEAVVESSIFGTKLYQNNGFIFVKNTVVPWPEPHQDRPGAHYVWMVRPKTAM